VLLTTPNAEYILTAERVVIGRAPTCDVVIEDSLVSWEHAIIRIGPTAAVIEDRQSSNGVYVNDVRLSEPYQLCDGDRILVGTQQLSVFSAVSRRRLQRSLGGPTDSAS
jgi:pSer/pThr/pTyr-binding forkhead associated (FHA) protein